MKKIISICLTLAMTFSSVSALAQTETFKSEGNTKAIVLCYDNDGRLAYSTLTRTSQDLFAADIPDSYKDTKKKVYFIDTAEFKNFEEISTGVMPTSEPVQTANPSPAPTQTEAPASTSTPSPTKLPSDYPAVYEKAMDAVLSPVMVKDVETSVDSDDDKYYSVTALYMGKETKIRINEDVLIETASKANENMAGETAGALEAGDVIALTANIAGTEVKHLYFICRPAKENIVTSSADYGKSFENLFSADGKVAKQWGVLEYGLKATDNRYQYAFGVIGKVKGNTITLINKDGDIDNAIEADMKDGTIVCVCDTEPKDYDVYVGDKSDIMATIPESILNKGSVELTDEYSYNYALVRIVDGTATDVMLFTNYNN